MTATLVAVKMMDNEAARRFIDSSDFLWHQRFALSPKVHAPGANDIEWLWQRGNLPHDLSGATVLDIGTTNGGLAFEAERRGAAKVVAVDIVDPDLFGFDALRRALESKVEFLRCSVYELPSRLQTTFDYVIFLGVLYHLRHPLMALDSVRLIARGEVFVETAVCDGELGGRSFGSVARFYRGGELDGDSSNWFAPSSRALVDWCESCGFEVLETTFWPARGAERGMVRLRPTPGEPEYQRISYEVPLRVSAELDSSARSSVAAT